MSTSSSSNQSQLNFGNTQQVAQQASIAKNYNHAINTINHNHFHNDLVEKQKTLIMQQNIEKQQYITNSGDMINTYGFTIAPHQSMNHVHQMNTNNLQHQHLINNTNLNSSWQQFLINYLEDKGDDYKR